MKLSRPAIWLVIPLITVIAYYQVAFLKHSLLWDMLVQYYPFRHYFTECVHNGSLPLWVPYQFTGYPFFADPQSGAWYPLAWLFSLLGNYTLGSLNIEFIVSVCLGGIGMYTLSKSWCGNKTAAIICGICYTGCGMYVSNAEHLTWVITTSWLPWLFWSYYKMVTTFSHKYSALFALFFYMIMSGGYPAFLIISIYIFLILFVALAIYLKKWDQIKNLLLVHSSAVFLALASSAVMLYSYVYGMSQSTRSGGVSLENALLYPFAPTSYLSFLFPFSSFKNPELFEADLSMTNGYFGVIGLVLFLVSLFYKKNKKFWLILFLSLFFLASAAGDWLPVRAFQYHYVPLMNFFRFPSIFRIFFIIGFLLLGSYSFIKLIEDQNSFKKRGILITSFLLLICIITAIFAAGKTSENVGWSNLIGHLSLFDKDSPSRFEDHLLIQSVFQSVVLLVLLLTILFFKGKKQITMIVLICAADIILSVQLNMYGTIINHSDLKASTEKIRNFPGGFPLQSSSNAVIDNKDEKYLHEMNPVSGNVLVFSKVVGKTGDNPFLLKDFVHLRKSTICDSVWSNPVFYFANELNAVEDTLMLSKKNNVIADAGTHSQLKGNFMPASSADVISCKEFGPNKISLATKNNGQKLFVLQQNWSKAWTATIDGSEAEINKVNYTYMAVLVPEGSHSVIFEFKAKGIIVTLCISIFFLIVCVVIATGRFRNDKGIVATESVL